MGIFDFVKEAGAKLGFGGGDDARDEGIEKLGADMQDDDPVLANRMRGNALARAVMGHGFEVEDLRVDYDDGTATVFGKVTDQATLERVILALGNVQGVARVDDRIEVAEPAPEALLYTVQSGDSLSKISLAHYGDAMKYMVIFEANQPMLDNPDRIYPGQVLRIPPLQD
jgi:nucleoid-associated protein YgaU